MSSESYNRYSTWDDVLSHSDRDIKNMRSETVDMAEYFNKLKAMNGNTRRRLTNLQSETAAMKSRMESLLMKRSPNSPDYQEYQTMRRMSKTSLSSASTIPRTITTAVPKESIPEIQPQSQQHAASVTITVS